MKLETFRAALLDRHWLLTIPVKVEGSGLGEPRKEDVLSFLIIEALNTHGVPAGHAALIDQNGWVYPGFFMWDPAEKPEAGLRTMKPLVHFTPQKMLMEGQPELVPDFSTLETYDLMRMTHVVLGVTLEGDKEKRGYPESRFRVDGKWRNCFFIMSRPMPTGESITDEIEKLANIRSIDLDEALWKKTMKEALSGNYTPSTYRIRHLIAEVCRKVIPPVYIVGMEFKDKEGVRV